jgi:hypothetical protein
MIYIEYNNKIIIVIYQTAPTNISTIAQRCIEIMYTSLQIHVPSGLKYSLFMDIIDEEEFHKQQAHTGLLWNTYT